ncbi:MAG: hypothetical protein ACRDKZ_13675 [Actinomycetota bacterium]
MPLLLWCLSLIGIVWTLVFPSIADVGEFDPAFVAFVVFVLAFSTVGALVASRQPGNVIGWLMCAMALLYVVGGATITYGEYSVHAQRSLPGETLSVWTATWVWGIAFGLSPLFLLLFPSGRVPSRRWRAAAWAIISGTALLTLSTALTPGPIPDSHGIVNPVGLRGQHDLIDMMSNLGGLLVVGGLVASVCALVLRSRRSRGVERQQLKWFTYAAALAASVTVVLVPLSEEITEDWLTDLTNFLTTLSLSLLPVAMGIAILRHRLYDIDRIVSRTLVYGAVTALLAGGYAAIVLLLQTLLPVADDSPLVVATSTLAMVALFRPLRRRVQRIIDRRFYRRHYDAEQTAAAFATKLRSEMELNAVVDGLLGAVRNTVQPAHASLWLSMPASGSRPR